MLQYIEGVDTCKECGHWTSSGKKKSEKQWREKPLSGIDLSGDLSKVVEGLRRDMVNVRSKFNDIRFAFPGWGESTEHVEGLLTCGISYLYYVMEKMKENEKMVIEWKEKERKSKEEVIRDYQI